MEERDTRVELKLSLALGSPTFKAAVDSEKISTLRRSVVSEHNSITRQNGPGPTHRFA
jgi:hypothetical protein